MARDEWRGLVSVETHQRHVDELRTDIRRVADAGNETGETVAELAVKVQHLEENVKSIIGGSEKRGDRYLVMAGLLVSIVLGIAGLVFK